jgi:glucose/arabinose dehydrogenase
MRFLRVLTGAVASLAFMAGSADAGITLVPAFSGSATAPIYVTAPPGDSTRLFVVERGGRIRVAVDGVMQGTPFLDISSRVTTTGEGGLLSMAFAPDYATSRKFYVYFVQKSDGHIHVEQFSRSVSDPNVADPTATTPLLDVDHPGQTNHYGGQLAFGPDGKLYAGTGDGGGANDPSGNAQNPSSQLGKLLAIDTSAPPPAVSTAALGLRNPFRFSFDRGTGDLVLGDVGQAKWEEIDWVPAGALTGSNFGWDCYEAFEHVDLSCDPSPRVDPVIAYANPNGASPPSAAVTGGVVVRDPALPTLFGRYLYADFFAGQIHSAALAKPVTDDRVESDLPTVPNLVAFGEDADAHVYVVSLNGSVSRIVCTDPCDGGTGGGTQPPPSGGSGQPDAPGSVNPPTESTPGTGPDAGAAAKDTTAPVLRIRAAHVQDVLRRRVVRLSLACDEACIVRASGRLRAVLPRRASALSLRGILQRLPARKRVVIQLRASARVRRALARRGTVTVTVRARDAAGNLTTKSLTVRVRR